MSTETPGRLFDCAAAWLITEAGKAGLAVQVKGVADALGAKTEPKTIRAGGLWKLAAPLGVCDPAVGFAQPGTLFAPPWPALAIGAGVASLPYLKALKRSAGPDIFTVAVQKSAPHSADLVCAMVHDRARGANVVSLLVPPHGYSAERLKVLRHDLPETLATLPSPRVALLLGGDNAVYRFAESDCRRLASAVASMAALGASFLVTPSRRTNRDILDAVRAAVGARPAAIWDGVGENPYPAFLAAADVLVVTADSVNMTGEASATGRPVYVFTPSGGSAKFRRFHEALTARGITRPLREFMTTIDTWSYAPLDSARIIADEVEKRWQRRAHMLSGLVHSQAAREQD